MGVFSPPVWVKTVADLIRRSGGFISFRASGAQWFDGAGFRV